MARLEGNKPNMGAIITGAIIVALVAGGIFFAFRGVPDDAENTPANAATVSSDSSASTDSNATQTDAATEAGNALTTILTPLPTATMAATPTPVSNSVAVPDANAVTAAPAPTPANVNNLATNSTAP